MADVFVGFAFALKNMPQMTITVVAKDLNSNSVGVSFPFDCSLNLIIKAWPTAMGLKFVLRAIQFCIALSTNLHARGSSAVVFAGSGVLGAFGKDHTRFLCR
jgi:hypothetical protein